MSVQFTANTTYLSRAFTSAAATLMAWLWVDADPGAAGGAVIQLANTGANTIDLEFGASSGMVLDLWNGIALVAGSTLRTGCWYHVAITIANTASLGTAIVSYVNGTQDVSTTKAGNAFTPNALNIGQDAGLAEFLPGRVHNVKVWTTVLTRQQILREMRSYAPQYKNTLFGWWPLTDFPTAKFDYGGKANHLTVQGTPRSNGEPPANIYKPTQTMRRRLRTFFAVTGGGGTFRFRRGGMSGGLVDATGGGIAT